VPKPKPVIFVVDDDISVRRALGRLIRSAGLEVRTFSSAQEFLDQVEWSESACLLLDIRMPGMNGLDLQRQITASGHSIPIVFLTAREDVEVYRQAMRQGAFAFLQKPCDDQTLLETIRKALDFERNTPA
jgi:FixJ family two-component response regulator